MISAFMSISYWSEDINLDQFDLNVVCAARAKPDRLHHSDLRCELVDPTRNKKDFRASDGQDIISNRIEISCAGGRSLKLNRVSDRIAYYRYCKQLIVLLMKS